MIIVINHRTHASISIHINMRVVNSYGEWEIKSSISLVAKGASGSIGPKHIVTLTSGFSARCRPMRPIFPVEFQL